MFLTLWEYEVKPGCEQRFEKVYGPEGDWVRLFQSDSHYHQTRLARDAFRQGVYWTMDFWQSREAYEEFMAGHRVEYKEMDAIGEEITVKEQRLGWFEMARE